MRSLMLFTLLAVCHLPAPAHAQAMNLAESPLFVAGSKSALVQMVVQRDNNLFYEAYPSYEDLNGDGVLDTRYKPDEIDYIGYFDSHLCYAMSGGDHMVATASSSDKTCSGAWSGDFLNYLSMTRMDIMLRSLYGGHRSIDTASETRLLRAFVPWDNHTWGIEYESTAVDGFNISDYAPYGAPASGTRHLFATNNFEENAVPYLRVRTDVTERIWEWVDKERSQGDGWSSLDLPLEVAVCRPPYLEAFCQRYPNGQYKPTGLLHEFGEDESMYFSLVTGSYENNKQGGVLRQPMASFLDNEVESDTGIFKDVNGIVSTLNAIQIPNDYEDVSVQKDCGWLRERPFDNGECRAWGNPVAEMMYEGMRYFSGEKTPTPEFYTNSGMDQTLGLEAPDWDDPYSSEQPYGQCSSAYQLVISDPAPSYDGDQLPGSHFSSFSGTGLSGLHVGDLADFISSQDASVAGLKFLGEAGGIVDGAPSAKMVTTLRDIRGPAPEAAHREGSYYASSIAYFGHQNDVNPYADGDQRVGNFTLALGSMLPTIDVTVDGKIISFAPYGKTIKYGDVPLAPFQPTNAIVSFTVEHVDETSGSFRVSFEDQEQGADNDQDSVIRYSYTMEGDEVVMTVANISASTYSHLQHLGFAVSGSDKDGVYLVIRSEDSPEDYDIDFPLDVPPGRTPGVGWNDGLPLPLSQVLRFKAGSDAGAVQMHSPLWYAAKWGGFDDLNNDGIPQDVEWDADSDGTPDNYFSVVNPSRMNEQLRTVFRQISQQAAAASSVAVSSSSLNSSSRVYQAEFQSPQWTGDITSRPISESGDISDVLDWSANASLEQQIQDDERQILSYNPTEDKGVAFRWPANEASPTASEISEQQIEWLSLDPITQLPDARGADRLRYLRGEVVDGFRERNAALGDIVHSSPQLVAAPGYYYPSNWGDGAPENSAPYVEFARSHRDRRRIVYVGANDGMLHAFDAGESTDGVYSPGSGKELFAYVPGSVYRKLPDLTHVRYSHTYYVDGTPRIGDAFDGTHWRTVLSSGLRGGGQGVFTLDVTDPDTISEATAASVALWEFTEADDADMGYSYASPLIARMNNGRWAAIVSNGYGSTVADDHVGSGVSAIFVLDLFSGELVAKLTAGETGEGHNGMSAPTAVDLDGDYTVDIIYAGDLAGNVHGFDVSGATASDWLAAAGSSSVLFTARDDDGHRQPITTAISVGSHPTGNGLMLYTGTGKYLEPGDQTQSSDENRIYGLWDKRDGTLIADGADPAQNLLAQNITGEVTRALDIDGDGVDESAVRVRESSQYAIDWSTHRGWYLDLVLGTPDGEQVVANPVLRDGRLFVSTHIPSGDECDPQQGGWLMVLDPVSGSMPSSSAFDLDGDDSFKNESPNSGLSHRANPFTEPTFAAAAVDDVLLTQSNADPETTATKVKASLNNGRLSWRELVP